MPTTQLRVVTRTGGALSLLGLALCAGLPAMPQDDLTLPAAHRDERAPGLLIIKCKEDGDPDALPALRTVGDRIRKKSHSRVFTALDGEIRKGKKAEDVHAAIKAKFPKRAARAKGTPPAIQRIWKIEFDAKIEPEEVCRMYAESGCVEYAEPVMTMRAQIDPNDPYWSSTGTFQPGVPDLWGLHKIEAGAAWDKTTGSPAVVVAVIDTGIDYNHPDLAANIWYNAEEVPGNGVDDDGNGFLDDFRGWDFVNSDNDPYDGHFHGTHVSGTIGGVGNNGIGVVGVNWQCRLMALKGLSDTGSGFSTGLDNAVYYAAANGADVTSNSYGGGGFNQATNDAFEYARSLGVVSVVAAGNNNGDAAFQSPANAPAVITVAASDSSDLKASFSNWGEKIDVAAPGVGILSCLRGGSGYRLASGTSMACPHAAGLAALLLAGNPDLDPEQVRFQLRTTADDLGDPGFDIYFGHGRINARRALENTNVPPIPPAPQAAIASPANGALFTSGPVLEVRGSASGESFASWRLEAGEASGWTTLAQGTSPVTDAVLGTWDLTGRPDGSYTVRLTATNTFSYVALDYTTVIIDSLLLPGWPVACDGTVRHVYSLDWDQDGSTEVVAVTSREIRVIGPDGQTRTGWPQRFYAGYFRAPVFLKYQASGPLGLFVADNLNNIGWIYRPDGTKAVTLNTIPNRYPLFSAASDLDGDGIDEIVTSFWDMDYIDGQNWPFWTMLTVLKIDGTVVPGWPKKFYTEAINVNGSFAAPAIGDVDGDGEPEIAWSPNRYLHVFSPYGTDKPGWPVLAAPPSNSADTLYQTPTLCDFDRDGKLEVVMTESYGQGNKMLVFRHDGTPIPGFVSPPDVDWLGRAPVCADLDGDGSLDILSTTADRIPRGWLTVIDRFGAHLPGWPVSVGRVSYDYGMWATADASATPVVADLDGDGRTDALFPDLDKNQVYAYSARGERLATWSRSLISGVAPIASPWIADVTGDDIVEILAGNTAGQVLAWRANGSPSGVLWNGHSQNLKNTRLAPLPPPDVTPPAAVADLAADFNRLPTLLTWTSVGDNGADVGRATSYDVRYSTTGPLTEAGWNAAIAVAGVPLPARAGTPESMDAALPPGSTVWVGMKVRDDVGNVSQLSNVLSGTVPVLSSISVSPGSIERTPGSVTQFTAQGYDAGGAAISVRAAWSTSAGTIGAEGLFTAPATTGNVTITASYGGIQGTALVNIVPPVLTWIAINPVIGWMQLGASQQFTVSGWDQTGLPMPVGNAVWSATGGTVTQTGLYTAPSQIGQHTIAATVGTLSASQTVTVAPSQPVLTTVQLTPDSAQLSAGGSVSFVAASLDQYGLPIASSPSSYTWSATGGTLSGNGWYTAPSTPGVYTVSATRWGITGSATVTVVPSPVLTTIMLTPASVTLNAGATQAFSAQGYDQFGSPISVTFSWSATGGSITLMGLYTAPSGGTGGNFTVTATSGALSKTSAVTVRNPSLAGITITPSQWIVPKGYSRPYTVSGFDATGIPTPVYGAVWTATAGTVDATGRYTAPQSGGLFTITGAVGSLTKSATARVPATVIRGDANGDGILDVLDVTYLQNYTFRGGPPPAYYEEGNANSDGVIDILDVTYLINYAFRGGPAPATYTGPGTPLDEFGNPITTPSEAPPPPKGATLD